MRTKKLVVDNSIESLVVMSDLHAYTEPLIEIDKFLAALPCPFQLIANGDFFMGGLRPAETFDWVCERAGDFITLGNHDEGTLRGGDAEAPSHTESGAHQRLAQSRFEFLNRCPHRLELDWRGKRIHVLHGHRTPGGRNSSWMARREKVIADFANPDVDLTLTGHTHFPFIYRSQNLFHANSGSTSGIILRIRTKEGALTERPRSPQEEDIRPSFLVVTEQTGELNVEIRRFTFDQVAVLKDLTASGVTDLEFRRNWFATGLLDFRLLG